ncbi:MAG: diguanylate cyclase [Gammaproteobacteria bacterium]|nr:diguanylate cyclase [Gammaproteobacteria bacterium]
MDNQPFVDAYQEINGRFIKLLGSMSALRALSNFEIKQHTEEELINSSLDVLLEYHELDFVSIYMYEGRELKQVASKNWNVESKAQSNKHYEQCEQKLELILQVEKTGTIQQSVPSPGDFPFASTAVPVYANSEMIGVFLACHPTDEFVSVTNERNLLIFCNFLGQLIMNSRLIHGMERQVMQRTEQLQAALDEASELKKRYEELSVIDELTQLHNRRFFFPETSNCIASALRYHKNMAVLMLDIDHFKKINDRYGHSVGDKVLCDIAQVFRDEAREVDIMARFGGEEFIFALPETGEQGALILAERIRNKVKTLSWTEKNKTFSLSVTIGITELMNETDLPVDVLLDELVKQADTALYHGKTHGRDQCVCFSEISCKIE